MTGGRVGAFFLILALAMAVVRPADTQIPQPTPTAVPTPLGRTLALDLGRSQVINLPRAARDVLVAAPTVADVVLRNPDTAFIIAKKIGETTVYFFDGEGRQIDQIDVTVQFDTLAIKAALRNALPHDDISVSAANQSVVLTGSVAAQQDADSAQQVARQFVSGDTAVVNLLRIQDKNQVLLRVRVTEMDRNTIKELGITPGFPSPLQFTAIGLTFDFAGTPTVFGNTAYGSVFFGAPGTPPAGTVPGALPTTTAPTKGLSSVIQALEQNGLVKTLAEPNLTAVSGETASFLVGGKFPLPSIVPVGTTSEVIPTYYPFGVQLTFTPTVLSSGLISLRIATTVSEEGALVAIGGGNAPNLTERSATTTVELPSGGSIALAGLLQSNINTTIQGLPGLMDLPILGALFSSKNFQNNETDLVIAVTAYLIRPVDPNAITFPTDGFGPASDFNMYFLGKLNATYTKPTPEQAPQPKGPFGFILE
jgi:pilus assembly protein CpaC